MYTPIDNKIISITDLPRLIERIRNDTSVRIVFSNGCFDLLHAGHVRRLEEARTYGDVHIVGVNSDSSVKGLKGDNRPIIDEKSRALCVAALDSVDYVVVFNESTPDVLLQTIIPDWYIIGPEYAITDPNNYVNTKALPKVGDISTTSIIDKIQDLLEPGMSFTGISFDDSFNWYD
jgi:rfaE bifunctional protein nucleotidyltransferase chain/domain